MELNRKTTGIIIIAASVIIGLVFIIAYSMIPKTSEEEAITNVYIEHPDADVSETSDSKIDAYAIRKGSKSSIENYWDSIEDVEVTEEDPMAEMTAVGKGTSANSLSALKERSQTNQNNIVRSSKSGTNHEESSHTNSGTGGSTTSSRMTRDEYLQRYQAANAQAVNQYMETYNKIVADQNAADVTSDDASVQKENKPEEVDVEETIAVETATVEKPMIKRSGNISTLDDSFGTLTTGVSSLDEESDILDAGSSHPLKCMFTKEEKIESGQRVSIRLLEDMVVGSVLVPKNSHLMAVCTIGNRLMLKVSSIELNGQIYAMNYEAYDNDGTKGIYCPDLDNGIKDAAKQSGMSLGRRAFTKTGAIVNEVANLGLTIAEMGSSGTKSVRVPSGYTFYLMDGKN